MIQVECLAGRWWLSENEEENSPSHGQRTLLRVVASEGQPCDVERVRECAENLGPDDTKVAHALNVDVGEDAVKYVAQQMAAEPSDDGLGTEITVERHGDC